MKTGPDALSTSENESGSVKHENWDPTPSVLPKTSTSTQNIKTGPNALITVENESGGAKYENGTRRLPHRRKGDGECKT
jgi:hypothetical protein